MVHPERLKMLYLFFLPFVELEPGDISLFENRNKCGEMTRVPNTISPQGRVGALCWLKAVGWPWSPSQGCSPELYISLCQSETRTQSQWERGCSLKAIPKWSITFGLWRQRNGLKSNPPAWPQLGKGSLVLAAPEVSGGPFHQHLVLLWPELNLHP